MVGPEIDVDLTEGAAIEITMESSTAGGGQVFWETTDGGVSESRSGRFETVEGIATYRLPVPAQSGRLLGLRLDPLQGDGDLAVQSIRVLPAG